jgi:hypothetical protein
VSPRGPLVVLAAVVVSFAFAAPARAQARSRTYVLLDGRGRQFTDTHDGEGIEIDYDVPSRAVTRRWTGRRWPEVCDALPLHPEAVTLSPDGRAGRAVEWVRVQPNRRALGDRDGTFAYPVRRPRPLFERATWTEETNLATYTFDVVGAPRVERMNGRDYLVWRVSGLVEGKLEPFDRLRLVLTISEQFGTLRIESLSSESSPCDVLLTSEPR